MRLLRLLSVLGLFVVLGLAVAPAALARPLADDDQGQNGRGSERWCERHANQCDNGAGNQVTITVPLPGINVNGTTVAPGQTLSFTLPPGLASSLVQQGMPRLVPAGPNLFLVDHPQTFCAVDNPAPCESVAQQLAQVAPGFGTGVFNGPRGYGVYVTYQPTW